MKPYLQAVVIIALLLVWMGLGAFKPKNQEEKQNTFVAPALKSVRVMTVHEQAFRRPVLVRASTHAERRVPINARVTAVVEDLPVTEGDSVSQGDLLCQLDEEDRRANLAERESSLHSAEVDWEATQKLQARQLSSELDIARKEANFKNAKARYERADLELQYTRIRAPFSGLVEDIPAEIGGVLMQGQPCALLVDLDPILVRGYIAEAEVEHIGVGAPVEVRFRTGNSATGVLYFVSRSADEASRTFRVEAKVSNPDRSIRHGLTADLLIYAQSRPAHHIPPSSLLLDAEAGVVVKLLDSSDTVRQIPVEILYDDPDGIWVSGLPDSARVITVGQYYVSAGQQVQGVEMSTLSDDNAPASKAAGGGKGSGNLSGQMPASELPNRF